MGLDINGTQFVLFAKSAGVDLSKLATIGRQSMHLWPQDLRKLLNRFGYPCDAAAAERLFLENKGYAEPFLLHVGAKEIHTFDNSSYEGATHMHDMNEPIPQALRLQYTAVLDGGSLEHIFNFPVALKNCMEMVAVGGHFLAITPSNNFCGHGFYQFSPELFFNACSEANGFAMEHLIAFEAGPNAKWYAVANPATIQQRVTLVNKNETYLLVIAKKVKDVEPFKTAPQQSDYVAAWDKNASRDDLSTKSSLRKRIMPLIPNGLKSFVRRIIVRGFKRTSFTVIDPTSYLKK
jgi:hypothetical protein